MTPRQQKDKDIQDTEDRTLILYRLERVETGVFDLNSKFDKLENIKKSDITELKNTVLERFAEVRADLQKQIDAQQQQLKTKADKSALDDFKKQIYAVAGLIGTGIVSLTVILLTRGK